MWSPRDRQLCRQLRIKVDDDDPPPWLPRFRVEPAEPTKKKIGWYAVRDARYGYAIKCELGPPQFKDARAAAEELARQLNEQFGVNRIAKNE